MTAPLEPTSFPDPFTLVYDGLWELIEKHGPLNDLVSLGNRIKRTQSNRPLKRRKQDADLPEIDIMPGGNDEFNAFGASGASDATQTYLIQVATGRQRVDSGVFRVKWELLRAMATTTQEGGVLGLPTWLTDIRFISTSEDPEDAEIGGGRKGWVTVLTAVAIFHFDRKRNLIDGDLELK